MASSKKYNPMDDLTPRGNLPSPEDNVTEGGPTQRNSPRRPPERKSTADRLKATAFKALNRTVGRVTNGIIEAGVRIDEKNNPGLRRAKNTADARDRKREEGAYFNRGGSVKTFAKGGSVSSASKRADGCVTKGKTRGKFV